MDAADALCIWVAPRPLPAVIPAPAGGLAAWSGDRAAPTLCAVVVSGPPGSPWAAFAACAAYLRTAFPLPTAGWTVDVAA